MFGTQQIFKNTSSVDYTEPRQANNPTNRQVVVSQATADWLLTKEKTRKRTEWFFNFH